MSIKKLICLILSELLTGGIMFMCFTGCFAPKYHVDYEGKKDSFKGAKDEYRAGATVKLYYGLIATDTDYSFFVDGERFNPDYSEKKGYIICFKMPEHDITVSVKSVNSMIAENPNKENYEKHPELSFHSFDGGGPSFDAIIEDNSIVKYDYDKKYAKKNHAELAGAGYDVYYTFTGLKPGKTTVKIEARSPIAGNFDYIYDVKVDENLLVSVKNRETIDIDARENEEEYETTGN